MSEFASQKDYHSR